MLITFGKAENKIIAQVCQSLTENITVLKTTQCTTTTTFTAAQ